ncbi:alpha-2C adrenergic receptor [Anthonomus grandis grandis]|uniref:alpha-2C adrenergic receptor n=1 Tax=Anthonomus grandis grandis TaxID=2921223 RepID=UPI00216633CC|nr:alpha-2C adrenergic receptor [Anthonomus grandis grandis]
MALYNLTARTAIAVEDVLILMENLTDNITNATVAVPHYPSGYTLPQIIIASIVVTFLMIVVVVGNMLVIIAIATEKALKNIQNWFIASLAVSDFFLGLVIMPFSLANELMGYWIFGSWWCDIHSAMDVLLSTASIMNLCLISLDRYWSITQAVEYLKKRTPMRAIVMIGAVWILSGLICIPPLLGWKVKRTADVQYPQCQLSEELGYVLYSALGSFYIPSCIMVFVYIRIYFAAKARARRGIRKHPRRPVTDAQTSFTNSAGGAILPPKNGNNQIDSNVSIDRNSNTSPRDGERQIATIETPAPNTSPIPIPTVTCDLASDISTSDNTNEPQEGQEEKDTLKVYISQTKGSPLLSCQLRNSTLSINGELQDQAAALTRTRQPSVGIDCDMVSEFDPSSSDSGVVAQCTAVKPLKLRLCKPIFGRSKHNKDSRSNKKQAKSEDSEVTVPKSVFEHVVPRVQKPRDPEREKRRIARKKEKRATLILGLIMGSFIACWLPFFFMYILRLAYKIPPIAFSTAFWLGYMNSALNPVIYTIFNKDFRRAFRRILFK